MSCTCVFTPGSGTRNCHLFRGTPHALLLCLPAVGTGVAGLAPVAAPCVENVDVSDIVERHHQYRLRLGAILRRVRLDEALDEAFVAASP